MFKKQLEKYFFKQNDLMRLRILFRIMSSMCDDKQPPEVLYKKRVWHRCFPENFAKFLGTPFLQSTSGRLLLYDEDFRFFAKKESRSRCLAWS